jgi:hypothetical protein
MNERKLRQLLVASALDSPPAPPADFVARVTAAARREPAPVASPGIAYQLELLFPRLAPVMLLVFGLCLAAYVGDALMPGPDLSDGVPQLSNQWDFPNPGF